MVEESCVDTVPTTTEPWNCAVGPESDSIGCGARAIHAAPVNRISASATDCTTGSESAGGVAKVIRICLIRWMSGLPIVSVTWRSGTR